MTNCGLLDARIDSNPVPVIANLKFRLKKGVQPKDNVKYDKNKLTGGGTGRSMSMI